MIWPVIILIVCLIFLLVVISVAVVQYQKMQTYSDAITNAWSPDDLSTDYSESLMSAPQSINTAQSVDRVLADFVVRMQHHEKTEIVPPSGTTLLASYGPENAPYFVSVFLQQENLIFAFRGTMTKREMKADMQTNQVVFFDSMNVHSGFYRVYMKYRDALVQWIRTPHEKIYITGYSLGGAMVNLLSLDLLERANVKSLYAVTFGAPRVGDESFAKRFDMHANSLEIVRYANKADIITSLPLNVMPNFTEKEGSLYLYVHSGKEVAFVENVGSWKKNHAMNMYIDFIEGRIT